MFAVISQSDATDTTSTHPKRTQRLASHYLQRSAGAVRLVFAARDGASHAMRVFQEGAAKVRFPNVPVGQPPEAVLLNIAGGMAGGDQQDISVALESGASATITTQACERIYRSLGDNAIIGGELKLEACTRLEWLPQPLIFFDGARLKRETRVSLAPDATLLAVESIIFGRTASGEEVEYGALSDAWFIQRAGRLIYAERFDTSGTIGATLRKPAVLNGNRAMATLRYVATDAQARLDEMRALVAESPIEAAASAWNGMMVVRIAAPDGYCLNRELARVLVAFRKAPLPRVWMQ